jgi:hypothetical protein
VFVNGHETPLLKFVKNKIKNYHNDWKDRVKISKNPKFEKNRHNIAGGRYEFLNFKILKGNMGNVCPPT